MIKIFANWLTYGILSITPDTLLAEAVNFFIYDIIKIFLLLISIIFTISILRTFLAPEKIRNILARKNKYFGNILAALFGIATPFCTCSAIPLFLGFLRAGVPLGATFSFLVSSPMINEVAMIMLFGMFGWRIALIYVFSGLIIAIISGIIIGKLKVENLLKDFVYENKAVIENKTSKISWKERTAYAKGYTIEILKRVWIYIVIGVGIGAWIHGYVPTDFLAKYAGADKWYAVPFATLIGIPLYSNAAGIIPLVGAFTKKGVSIGTALAFMMAVTALSLPEFMILRTVMKTKLIIIFASVVGIGIIFTGYLFNLIIK